ncbi:hypothetical protein AYI68_g7763 [Smittium mucronatum]|uniref:Uncharacterized protein n=1 Tax=Smittium mucronatum TaxID=133383 RepID=A0A1R0GMT1_9FUNG|nr:hypothetical protein AYI68_g7763 [Smittium mucronatum]
MNTFIGRRPQDGTICVPKNQFDELHSATAEISSLNRGEEVGYHSTPDPDGACPIHTTDRLILSKILERSSTEVTPSEFQEKAYEKSEIHPNEGSIRAAGKESHRGSTATDFGSDKSQSECGGTEFQDGNPGFHLKNVQTKGLHNVARPAERFNSHYFLH